MGVINNYYHGNASHFMRSDNNNNNKYKNGRIESNFNKNRNHKTVTDRY